MVIEQRAYINELKRADTIRNRYGNRTAIREAAGRRLRETLASIGYSPTAIEVIRKDAYDVYKLERDALD